MKSTRDRILQTLLNHPLSTINDLARAVSINAISVRHHLTSLQAEGLVNAEEERHGVGRPRLLYLLSEKGQEHFPTRYLQLTNRLLDQLKENLPPAVVNRFFEQMAADMASGFESQLKNFTIEEKLNLVRDLLTKEGFSIEWEKEGDHYKINEVSCPYYHIGQNHPEVCTVDQTLLSTMLSIPVEKTCCVLQGDALCSYTINSSRQLETTS